MVGGEEVNVLQWVEYANILSSREVEWLVDKVESGH